MSFAKYAAVVKNLRGVVAIDLSEKSAAEGLRWLAMLYRYRDLGVVPSAVRVLAHETEQYLGGRPLRKLELPVPELKALPGLLHSRLELPLEAAEALVYASTYVSPALVIGKKLFESLLPFAAGKVLVCKEMDRHSWKLHLRIADYTILDFYEACVDEALKVIEGLDPEPVLVSRLERVKKDVKRYWRVQCDEGQPLLLYVDNLALAIKAGGLKNLETDCAAALAIVPVVHVLVPSG